MARAVEVEGLAFRYPFAQNWALSGISFGVEAGERLLLLGPSGSGKSTLALCLNGMIPQSIEGEMVGRVVVEGEDTQSLPLGQLCQKVGVLFQDPESQFCMLTVEEEVAFGLENLGLPREEMDRRMKLALEALGLAEERKRRLDRLSGGTKQRVALASLLAMGPKILVLDEPTSNLDPAGTREVFATLERLCQSREHTLIIIEHKLDDLMPLIDRVIVLGHDGKIVAQGEPREVFAEQGELLAEYGLWLPQASELAHALRKRGIFLNPHPLTAEEAMRALAVTTDSRDGEGKYNLVVGVGEVGDVESRDAAFEIQNLSYTYPRGNPALKDVSLKAQEGDFRALIGANASGKTTLALHLAGIIPTAPEKVHLFGRDLSALPSRDVTELVGYIFQNPEHQFVAESVYQELAFSLRARKWPEARVRERVEEMLEKFGLAEKKEANPFSLSQGEKRRLSVASMLLLNQKLLILDEPTFGLDRRNAYQLLDMLADLNAQGRTILLITHDMRIVAEYAKKVAVLSKGQVLYQGTVQSLFARGELLHQADLNVPVYYQIFERFKVLDPSFREVSSLKALSSMPARVAS